MDPEHDRTEPPEANEEAERSLQPASAWLWHPWYAKFWWACIAIYWLPAGGPTRVGALADFYESSWAAIPNLIFLPVTALLVLGFGYFQRLMSRGEPVDFYEDIEFGTRRLPGLPHPTMDEFDPRSGPHWIGNRPLD